MFRCSPFSRRALPFSSASFTQNLRASSSLIAYYRFNSGRMFLSILASPSSRIALFQTASLLLCSPLSSPFFPHPSDFSQGNLSGIVLGVVSSKAECSGGCGLLSKRKSILISPKSRSIFVHAANRTAGALGNTVAVTREKSKITVTSDIDFPKRYDLFLFFDLHVLIECCFSVCKPSSKTDMEAEKNRTKI